MLIHTEIHANTHRYTRFAPMMPSLRDTAFRRCIWSVFASIGCVSEASDSDTRDVCVLGVYRERVSRSSGRDTCIVQSKVRVSSVYRCVAWRRITIHVSCGVSTVYRCVAWRRVAIHVSCSVSSVYRCRWWCPTGNTQEVVYLARIWKRR